MAYINVHVDLEDIYDDLSKKEKEMLIDWLEQDDVLPTVAVSSYKGIMNQDFNDVCSKLAQSYYKLSKEDEQAIIEIAKKYSI
jgi:hypothetical protein